VGKIRHAEVMPFSGMWCVVPPGGRTNVDCHPERELAIIIQGSVDVVSAGRSVNAGTGSAVLLEGLEDHVVMTTRATASRPAEEAWWSGRSSSGT
jgi:hypothetical protein